MPLPTFQNRHTDRKNSQGKFWNLHITTDRWSPSVDLRLLFQGRPLFISYLGYDVSDFLGSNSFKVETDNIIPWLHHRDRTLNNTREKRDVLRWDKRTVTASADFLLPFPPVECTVNARSKGNQAAFLQSLQWICEDNWFNFLILFSSAMQCVYSI